MATPYSSDYRPLGSPVSRFLVLPDLDQLSARKRRLSEPQLMLAGLEASLSATTLEELIRDLAGWSVPPTGSVAAGRAGAQWLW
ncbi:hypothetical protein A0257_11765 [Hymenobacter psoromatis]|nr:hypothetical protein A0257_11765 [Hymenobacter psoromatis]